MKKYFNKSTFIGTVVLGIAMFFINWGLNYGKETIEHNAEAKVEYRKQLEEYADFYANNSICLLYTSPSPRDS